MQSLYGPGRPWPPGLPPAATLGSPPESSPDSQSISGFNLQALRERHSPFKHVILGDVGALMLASQVRMGPHAGPR